MRVVGIFAMTVGLAMLVGVVPLYLYQSRLYRQDQIELQRLQEDAAAWEDSLAVAESQGDSATALERIAGRRDGVARSAYHVANSRDALERWWRPTGSGGTIVIAGLFLFAIGSYALRRALLAPWSLPPPDSRYGSQG